jgi:hypothetical protein
MVFGKQASGNFSPDACLTSAQLFNVCISKLYSFNSLLLILASAELSLSSINTPDIIAICPTFNVLWFRFVLH